MPIASDDPRTLRRWAFGVAAFVFGAMVIAALVVSPGAADEVGMTRWQAFGFAIGGELLVAWPLTLLGLGGLVVGFIAHLAVRAERRTTSAG